MIIVYDNVFKYIAYVSLFGRRKGIYSIVWEEIGDVLHYLRGDRGWTPLIIKLAGVSRVKVPKPFIHLNDVDD